MRYSKTSGARIKAVAERCTRTARNAAHERAHRGADGMEVDATEDAESAAAQAIVALLSTAAGASSDALDEYDADALVADVAAMPARVNSKQANRARRTEDYERSCKLKAFTLTLEALDSAVQSGKRPVAKPLMRRAVGVLKERVRELGVELGTDVKLLKDTSGDYTPVKQCEAKGM